MIQVRIHPDVRGKYVVTVYDPEQPDNDVLLSSTSQGYEGTANPEAMVRRLFGGPHAAAYDAHGRMPGEPPNTTIAAASYAIGGAGQPEPVELYVEYLDGTVRGPERLR